MADITPERINIQSEETAYRSAVSEATMTRVGASVNFINYYQFKHFEFGFMKGVSTTGGSPTYNIFTPPLVISDGEAFPTDSEIVGITFEHGSSGSGGTSELDIEWSASNSGTWATIFSTTPKVTSAAPSEAQFDTFGNAVTPTGCTVPVLSKTTFVAGDRLRCKAVTLQTGTPNQFMMRIYYRPI